MPADQIVLIAHPSSDRYGSDLQLLETISAIVESGGLPMVIVPSDGPLVSMLIERGASVEILSFPVLRKSALRPIAMLQLLGAVAAVMPRIIRTIRASGASTVLVNTITIPWWLLGARLTRRHTVCHVHEAEQEGPLLLLTLLGLPNLLASRLVVNSAASAQALVRPVPLLRRKIQVVHNGIAGPDDSPEPPRRRNVDEPATLVLVARLSPRKGIDVALEAVAELNRSDRHVSLIVCGSTFPGYEWFENQLKDRASRPDLAGHVEFRGYVSPTWSVLASADVVLVPSRFEPFGNTAVEALLARRPLIASNTQGLAEIVVEGQNGLLASPGDAGDLASRVASLLDDPELSRRLADHGRADALQRFSPDAYRSQLRRALNLVSSEVSA